MILESVIIGILAGGWASSTYWPGEGGILIGVTVGLVAYAALLIKREEAKEKKVKRSARPERRDR